MEHVYKAIWIFSLLTSTIVAKPQLNETELDALIIDIFGEPPNLTTEPVTQISTTQTDNAIETQIPVIRQPEEKPEKKPETDYSATPIPSTIPITHPTTYQTTHQTNPPNHQTDNKDYNVSAINCD